MPENKIIVVGASAGGLDVLKNLVSQLPPDLPASLFVVWHMLPDSQNFLAEILERASVLPIMPARDGEDIVPGRIYVAVPDHHLVVERDQVRVTRGPRENRFRPSIDVLFRSAALNHGSRVTGVVLSGMLADGASGLYAIKEQGGTAIVQDPVEAPYFEMPINAMRAAKVDYVLPIGEIGALLTRLVTEANRPPSQTRIEGEDVVSENMETEVRIALEDSAMYKGISELGEPSMFTCPECHGVLLQIQEGNTTRFRCHTGHAFSWDALMGELNQSIEDTLWGGVRALQESEMLYAHLAKHLEEGNEPEAARLLQEKVEETKQRADLVRKAILGS